MRGFLLLLLFLAVAFVALGFYQGWFRFADNEVKVDKDKMKEDTKLAKEKAKEIGKNIKEKAGEAVDKIKDKSGSKDAAPQKVAGTVQKMEPAENRFVVAGPEDSETLIQVTDQSTLRKGDKTITLTDLKAGDRVSVSYRVKGGKNEAVTVNLEPPA
jgi:hypothetical protein